MLCLASISKLINISRSCSYTISFLHCAFCTCICRCNSYKKLSEVILNLSTTELWKHVEIQTRVYNILSLGSPKSRRIGAGRDGSGGDRSERHWEIHSWWWGCRSGSGGGPSAQLPGHLTSLCSCVWSISTGECFLVDHYTSSLNSEQWYSNTPLNNHYILNWIHHL